ncbi:hypothetical protein C7212DRAFT_363519 [Tuber magnatum]|uniref:Cyanovirin-N domain-containing protein n=1 Tax=Tuber magnatum TaxID=42249 RepID=A0A317SR91_9PEZI|nr:hypothetical protein C7212DRAFT_363519 [Tuber magnatum]
MHIFNINTITTPALFLFLFILPTPSAQVPGNQENSTLSATEIESLSKINTIKIPISFSIYQVTQKTPTSAIQILNETIAVQDLTCETNRASPYVWDIARAANLIRNGNWCVQKNPVGSMCTKHVRRDTASLGTCGTFWLAVRCRDLSWVGDLVIANCRWKYQAGGQYLSCAYPAHRMYGRAFHTSQTPPDKDQ